MLKFVRILACLLATVLLLSALALAVGAAPVVSGECACLYLPQNNILIYDKNAHKRHPMASTTKIMTALVVLENCNLDETVVIPKEATGIEGSSIYLKPEECHTVENLLYALLLASANDAAAALAIHAAGNVEAFADMMNECAAELALQDTHFTNPHGLADPEHYTTAADLARITAAAMQNQAFSAIVSTKSKVISTLDGSDTRTLINHNKLLRQYEDCVGVKTGFTKKSGRCLVSAAERDNMLLIAVTLDAPDDWRDHTSLLDYGFSLYEGRELCEANTFFFDLPVIGGKAETVRISARNQASVVLERDSAPLKPSFEINRFAIAPIKEGQVLGMIRYTQNGRTVATVPLLAEESVVKAKIQYNLFEKIKNFLNL